RAERAALERPLERQTPLARQRPVIGKRELLTGQRIDARRHLLRLCAIVDEDQRRPCLPHVAEHLRRDRWPDGAADLPEIFYRRFDGELDLFDETAIDDGARTGGKLDEGRRTRDARRRLVVRPSSLVPRPTNQEPGNLF